MNSDLFAYQKSSVLIINIKLRVYTCLINRIPEIALDYKRMAQVLTNIIGNAVKFTPQNGKISVRATADAENITIAVADTGIGMQEEELTNLFTEFYRIDNEINQNVKGTGLGLVLAKNIVQAHRGKMWVQSKVGSGTTFYFTLPGSQKAFEEHLNQERTYA